MLFVPNINLTVDSVIDCHQFQTLCGVASCECGNPVNTSSCTQQLLVGSTGGSVPHTDCDLCAQLLPHAGQLEDVPVQSHSLHSQVSAGFSLAVLPTYLLNVIQCCECLDRHWRISHAFSHHLYPNTHHDLEISQFEPLMQFFPLRDKSNVFGLMSALYSPLLVYPLVYIGEAVKRYVRTGLYF